MASGSGRSVQTAAWQDGGRVREQPYHHDCPDIWELDNGDIAIVGRDVTAAFADRLPADLRIGDDERLVVIPGNMLSAAKPDIADA